MKRGRHMTTKVKSANRCVGNDMGKPVGIVEITCTCDPMGLPFKMSPYMPQTDEKWWR